MRVTGARGVAVEHLAEIVRDAHPDVLQVGPLPLAARLSRALALDLPVVIVSYGWDAQLVQREGWETFAPGLLRADGAICDCRAIEDALRSRCRAGVPIARFPWGVDIDHFTPHGPRTDLRSRYGWPAGDAVLLATRKLEPLYDPLTLVDAVAASALVDRLRLVFLGEGKLRAAVIDRAQAQGIGSRVVVAPPVPEHEVAPLMRGADVWVNAAHADGASISLLQALACGTPVVTPDLVCAREWADESVGALYSAGDPVAAAAAICDVLGRASGLGVDCRRRAVERADWRIHARTYSDAILNARRLAVTSPSRGEG